MVFPSHQQVHEKLCLQCNYQHGRSLLEFVRSSMQCRQYSCLRVSSPRCNGAREGSCCSGALVPRDGLSRARPAPRPLSYHVQAPHYPPLVLSLATRSLQHSFYFTQHYTQHLSSSNEFSIRLGELSAAAVLGTSFMVSRSCYNFILPRHSHTQLVALQRISKTCIHNFGCR